MGRDTSAFVTTQRAAIERYRRELVRCVCACSRWARRGDWKLAGCYYRSAHETYDIAEGTARIIRLYYEQ